MYYTFPPLGVQLLRRFACKCSCISRETKYRYSILILTYIAYCLYHLSRRPFTIVKSKLAPNCTDLLINKKVPFPPIEINDTNRDTWCAWAPFDVENPNALFGILDSFYLFSYAVFMFLSGYLAERIHLRYFLSFGMIFSGIFTYLFGLAYYFEIHNLYYFIVIQIFTGFFQTTGWPAVVSAVGNWCPKESLGVTFGIWNSHTNLGNMIGAYVSGLYVDSNWGLSFIIPGFIIAFYGFLLFLFIVPYPQEVGLQSASKKVKRSSTGSEDESNQPTSSRVEEEQRLNEDDPLIECAFTEDKVEAISFTKALFIPGVLEYSFSLFFCKMISYTFLYWLPLYIKETTSYTAEQSADLSMVFDLGGIVGSIVIGFVSDYTGLSAIPCMTMLLLAAPVMLLFIEFNHVSLTLNIIIQFILGALVNGPYCLITTSVAVDLGSKVSNKQGLATVSGIVDSIGSIGSSIGPMIAGFISQYYGWNSVFYLIIVADLLSFLLLMRVGINEAKKLKQSRRNEP